MDSPNIRIQSIEYQRGFMAGYIKGQNEVLQLLTKYEENKTTISIILTQLPKEICF